MKNRRNMPEEAKIFTNPMATRATRATRPTSAPIRLHGVTTVNPFLATYNLL